MYYLYIFHSPSDIQYIGSYCEAEDALDHGRNLLVTGDGYWPKTASVLVSEHLNLETE